MRHEPVRLTVVIAAPEAAIGDVLCRHSGVRDLFDNGWLGLMAMDDAGRITRRYTQGGWLDTGEAPAIAAE